MCKENNKGFTLIELIISVAILAIVAAPFLNAFVIAGKSNLNSSIKQKTTDYGESTMEKFKATTFDALTKTGEGADEGEFEKIDKGLINTYAGQNYYYYDSANKEYVFNLNAQKLTGRSGSGYTAQVKMKPVTYNAPDMADIDGKNSAILVSEVYKNDKTALNELYDYISLVNDADKSNEFKSTNVAENIDNAIREKTVRSTYIYVTYDAADGTTPFKLSVSTIYECKYGSGIARKNYDDVYSCEFEDVPDILLFYTLYKYNSSVTSKNDMIYVDNQIPDNIIAASGKKCNVYISNQTVAVQNQKKLKYVPNSTDSNIMFQKGGANNSVTLNATTGVYENSNTNAFMANGIYDYTNVNPINSLVGVKEEVSLYEITVDIMYEGNVKYTLVSTTDS